MTGLVEVEPTDPELLAIEAEWPVCAAELAVVEAECRLAARPGVGARRGLRRAESVLVGVLAERANTRCGVAVFESVPGVKEYLA